MPSFPPGSDQHVNLGVTPTWIFTPNTSAANTVRLVNEGSNTCFVGQADVTPFNGIPVPPGGKPVVLSNITYTLYGVSNVIGASSGRSSKLGEGACAAPARTPFESSRPRFTQ